MVSHVIGNVTYSALVKNVISGGYKAAINTNWIKENNVSLIVNTAKGMELVLGPKFARDIVKRNESCLDTEILELLMNDDLQQRLDIKDLRLAACLLYTSPSPRDGLLSRMPSSA